MEERSTIRKVNPAAPKRQEPVGTPSELDKIAVKEEILRQVELAEPVLKEALRLSKDAERLALEFEEELTK